MLTAAQHDELATRGLTYVRGAISRDQAAAIEDRVWTFFAKRGIDRDDRTTWPPGGLQSGMQGLRQADVFAPFAEPLTSTVDQLLGAGAWTQPVTAARRSSASRNRVRGRFRTRSGISTFLRGGRSIGCARFVCSGMRERSNHAAERRCWSKDRTNWSGA